VLGLHRYSRPTWFQVWLLLEPDLMDDAIHSRVAVSTN
jgi:hypothetical protein